MTVAVFKLVFKSSPHLRPTPVQCVRKVLLRSLAAVEAEPLINKECSFSVREEAPAWKRVSSREHGIRNSMIGNPTKMVLNGLKKMGHDVYLVGGCVRDLILKQNPKYFDIVTSAELEEVMRTFSWCEIVDNCFPACHVHMDGTIVEVSSFNSAATHKLDMEITSDSEAPHRCDKKDHLRWMNCLERDFTINALMYDPYTRVVFDYVGGMEDIGKSKVRTVIPADTSFQKDGARILRAIRIAACLGFSISKETAHFVKNLSSSVLKLDKGRLLLEINYMLAYGSGEASLRLLWKFGLLDLLLPFQAAYFVHRGFRRRDKRTNMLLSFFSNLDKLLAPNRPCHSSLWVVILALHKSLSDQPRDPLAVAAFSLAVHNGGNLVEAANIAMLIDKPHDVRFPELLDPSGLDAEVLAVEILDLVESVRGTLFQMTNEYFISQAMAEYPQAPHSDLVFIPLGLYLKALSIFDCLKVNSVNNFDKKQGRKIDYESLARGNLQEIRHVFARLVFDTVYPLHLNEDRSLNSS